MSSQHDQPAQRVPTGERAAQKRRAILRAARAVFLRDGFSAGMDLIASEADVSKVTIYNHFGSKDQLFVEVIGNALEEALTTAVVGAESRLTASDDLREALLWTAQAWIDGMVTPEVLALRHLMLREVEHFPELGQTWKQHGPDRARPALAEAFGRLVEQGRLDMPDVDVAIIQLYSLALYPHLIHAAYGTTLDPDFSRRLVESGIDMFLAFYKYKSTDS